MILWDKTEEIYGVTIATATQKDTIIAQCSKCKGEFKKNHKAYKQSIKIKPYLCPQCGHSTSAYRKKQSRNTAANWQVGAYEKMKRPKTHAPHSEATKRKIGEQSKILWADDDFRSRVIDNSIVAHNTPEYKNKMQIIGEQLKPTLRDKSIALWQDPAYRDKHIAITNSEEYKAKQRASHATPDYLKQCAERLALQPKVSNIQTVLYSILDDLGVAYYREHADKPDDSQCRIGPYSFDCVIPRSGDKTLLIECQGDYWHSRPKSQARDLSKSSYINDNLGNTYELKYLWEHEFSNKDRIIETLKLWLGLATPTLQDFEFDDITIKRAVSKDYILLLSKYHYLANAGRGGIAYGAYLNDELIAVCVFSPLIRQNITVKNYETAEIRELSRFCIHPNYQKKNFGSWFIAKCLNLLPSNYKCIIAYSDTTYNHLGTIYKASNFKQDRKVRPDYWYVAENGWVMHKKTLYNRARKMSMTEKQFADTYGYGKSYGREKLRFTYER